MLNSDAVWLVTGCSSGLGRAIGEQVLEAGYRLVTTARDPSALTDLVEKGGARAMAVALDVTDTTSVAAAVRAAEERFGAVDVLVNNAGYGYFAALEEGEEADIQAMFQTNVYGPWRVAKAVLPGMRDRGHGHIVNISSVGGLVTFPAVGFYHMAKFALEGFSETLAKELQPFGVGVTVVEPGAFRTEFRGTSMKQSAIRLPALCRDRGQGPRQLDRRQRQAAGRPGAGWQSDHQGDRSRTSSAPPRHRRRCDRSHPQEDGRSSARPRHMGDRDSQHELPRRRGCLTSEAASGPERPGATPAARRFDHETVREEVANVTGASGGIGLATALPLASEGARLALLARDAGRFAEALSKVEAARAPGCAHAGGRCRR